MKTELQQNREARNEYARMARNLLEQDTGSRFTAAHQASYDRYVAQIERLDDEIKVLERAREGLADERVQDAIDTAYRERRAPRDPLMDTFLRNGEIGFTAEQQLAIRNTMSTTTGSQGGFTVPTEVATRFADILKDYSSVRRAAEVITANTGGPFGWPISDGSAETGEVLAENAAASALDPSFATASLQTWRFSSKIFTCPVELFQDSNLDIEGYILNRAASRIGRIQNTLYTTGNGAGTPTGFSAAAAVGKIGQTGETITIIHDDIVDLSGSVDPAYRLKGAVFMTSDAGRKVLLKLKDSQARPLYLPSALGEQESIAGYPLLVNNDIAVPAANARSLFFGSFESGYKIVRFIAGVHFQIHG
jgi:HK97 family phage major capsid protein